jgi:dCTP deaminase
VILNDNEIRALAVDGFIRPFYPQNIKHTHIPYTYRDGRHVKSIKALSYGTSSFGYDFTLADEILLFTADYRVTLNVKDFNKDMYTECLEVQNDEYGRFVVLPPHSFVLGHTVEYVKMPDDILGICFDKSTYARIGGIQTNVTPIEPGWEGQITLEIRNTLPCFTRLYVGEGIIQTTFFRGNRPETTYADKGGKYQKQQGVTGARM